jgi:hypothetical protein
MRSRKIIKTGSAILRYLQGNKTLTRSPFIGTPLDNGQKLKAESEPQLNILDKFHQETKNIIDKGIPDVMAKRPVQQGLDAIDQQAEKTKSELAQLLCEQRNRTKRELTNAKEAQQEIRNETDYLKLLEGKRLEETNKAHSTIQSSKSDGDLKKLADERGNVWGVKEGLEEEIRQQREKYEHLDLRFQHMLLNLYQQMPPMKKWIHDIRFFVALVFLLVILEIKLNFISFQISSLGDNNGAAILLALFFGVCQALAAKEFGKTFLKKQQAIKYGKAKQQPLTESQTKKINQALHGFGWLTIFICLLMGAFRLGLEDSNEIKAVYIVINFIIALVTGILAYYHVKDQDFFDTENKRSQLAKKLNLKRSQLARIESELEQRIQKIDWEIKEQARKMAESEKKRCRQDINRLEAEIDSIETREKQWQDQLKHQVEKAKSDYQTQYDHANRRHVIPERKIAANGYMRSGKILPLLLLMALGTMSCIEQKPETHIEILYDQTEIVAQPNVNEMIDFILEKSRIDLEDGNWGKVTVNFSTIGETSTQKVLEVTLDENESYWSRNERLHKEKPAEFREALVKAMDVITQAGDGTKYSYIHRNYYYRLKKLAEKQGTRFMFSWCDLILNNPPLDFHNYRDNPETLLEEQDSFITTMTRHYPLKHLEGVQLVNIHQASRYNDALHESCKRYFQHYWQGQLGMEVTFLTNIPNQTMATAKTADK